jgi:periplasmic protein TonB
MKKIIVLNALMFLLTHISIAQNGTFDFLETPDTTSVLDVVDTPPQYAAGEVALYTFIYQRLKFPPDSDMLECTVYVGFVVNEDGSLKNIAVKKGFNRAYNEEAVRVVSALPKWRGGKHQGRPRKVSWVIPIRFRFG